MKRPKLTQEEKEREIIKNNMRLRKVVEDIDRILGQKSKVEIESWFNDEGNLCFMFRGKLGNIEE